MSKSTRMISHEFRQTWRTPTKLYEDLNKEFHFDYDPCPPNPTENGLFSEWGEINFVNCPYGKPIRAWLEKALMELSKGRTSVFLLPAYTDVAWFHDIILPLAEIRFIRGRLRFDNSKNSAPFASMICIFRP